MDFKTAFLILALLLDQTTAASYNYTSCAGTAYLSTANLKCTNCPANQIANTYQSLPIACQCKVGFAASGNGGCSALSAACGVTSNTYFPLYSLSGSVNSVSSCGSCAANAYTNRYLDRYSAMGLVVSHVVEAWCTAPRDVSATLPFLPIFAVILGVFLPHLHPRPPAATTPINSNTYLPYDAALPRVRHIRRLSIMLLPVESLRILTGKYGQS